MTRIAVGGFRHETDTFAPTKATYADFEPIAERPIIRAAPGAMPNSSSPALSSAPSPAIG